MDKPAARKLALFLDGTWNTSLTNTNVWRLKSLYEKNEKQLVYYSKGVGTNKGEYISGGSIGLGLDTEITDAYEWLIENFQDGDELFIFGFSRGAFTARSIAGLVSKFGLLKRGSPLGVGELYERYQKHPDACSIRELVDHPEKHLDCSIEDRWLQKYSRAIPIRFLGVWDTVGALGIPWSHALPWSRSKYQFHESDLRINETYAYHALAIDEHRHAFRPTLWTKSKNKNSDNYADRIMERTEQRWFIGAHANVGGGYDSDLLAQIPLDWLMKKAASHGLQFVESIEIEAKANEAKFADSFAEFLWGAGRLAPSFLKYYRIIGADAAETSEKIITIINETIDASVFDRWRVDPTYRPKNLCEWAKRKTIDPADLHATVRADEPGTPVN